MKKSSKRRHVSNDFSTGRVLDELIASLKSNATIVFCGAGISFNSGSPLAKDVIRQVLEKLDVNKQDTAVILKSKLPFESFIETLVENSNVRNFFDIFNIGKPNTNHLLLAKLVKAKKLQTICTTNFDMLIEAALETEGLVRGVDFNVFYKENDFKNINWKDKKTNLIKIHGSVEEKENMAITIQQVASETLSNQRKDIINRIYSIGDHKDVLVLGYSCSDVFDLNPQIETIRRGHKNIFFIEHWTDVPKIEDIASKNENNPFKNFTHSKRILYDTNNLIELLWKALLPEEEMPGNGSKRNELGWQKIIDDWYSECEMKYGSDFKHGIVGHLLYKITEFEKAEMHFKYGLQIVDKDKDLKRKGLYLGCLGNVYEHLGNYTKAVEYHERALTIAKNIGHKKREGSELGNLGNSHQKMGNYQLAMHYHNQNLEVLRMSKDRYGEGCCLGNIGTCYLAIGDPKSAISYHKDALKIARSKGYKKLESNELGSLGIAFHMKGDYKTAIRYYTQALGIAETTSDKRNECSLLGNLAATQRCLNNYRKTIEYAERALVIAREISDKQAEASCFTNLGNAYFGLNDFYNAAKHYKNAMNVVKKIGDKHCIGISLGNIGNVYYKKADYKKAISNYKEAIKLIQKVGDMRNLRFFQNNLEQAYLKTRRIP